MSNIITAGALLPSTPDTPLDARTRISNLDGVESINNPYIGMIFYCTGTGKHYKVKTLKSVSIGSGSGNAVDTYEEFGAQQAATSWDNLPGKPSTFPPSEHTHDYSGVYALDGHTHDYSGVYALDGHTHTVEEITDLPDLSDLSDLSLKKHSHSNKDFLDGLTPDSFYSKSEIDNKFGDFETAANAILGEES